MGDFIKELENLKIKIDEAQVYADQAREAIKRAREIVDNLEVVYLVEQNKKNEKTN